MKAVIMAGGEGTRLRPLTSLRPKPMVPIVNQPVMEHIVGLVRHYGITDIVATLAFMPQAIEDYFGDGEEWGVSMRYAIEETPLGTAGSVKNAERLLGADEPFLIISGDALTDIDLSEVIAFHREKGAAVTIALKRVDDPLDFGVVITDEDGRIERFLEKPTWGQVFSDQINTGIYVIEPWVLAEIPAAGAFDFSGDLFPKLMEQGHALYGCSVDGYWCDVGSRESYLEAHRDILDGKAKLFIPGVHAREGLWVPESANIDPTAVLGRNVVIGENTTVRAGAVIDDYVVIGDNCLVGVDARVKYSVVWDDTLIGKHATVEGAILGRRVDVRARAVVQQGVTIGDESMVGVGAHIGTDVQIYPYKRIEPAATVNSSVIWESTAMRSIFVDGGIEGIVGIDVTPELALRVAEAYGSTLPKGAHVVVARDNSHPARMLKRAMIAGLNASGINTRDLRVSSPALNRFTTQKTRCVGGVHISASPSDPQAVVMRFFDSSGLDISPAVQKKIERLYFRGEFRRAFFNDVGEILYPARPLEYYTSALNEAMDLSGLSRGWRKVVADMRCGAASLVLPQVGHAWQLNVIALNPVVDTESGGACGEEPEDATQLAKAIELFAADYGVIFDAGAERIRLITNKGEMLDGDTTLHAVLDLWCRTRSATPGEIAVPLIASIACERIASKYGRTIVRPGKSRRTLAQAVLDGRAVFAGSTLGGFIFGDFFPAFDGVLATGMIARMLDQAGISLQSLVDELPPFHKTEVAVPCPADRKGAVMRRMTEWSADLDCDLTEGIRVLHDDGWALVLPDANDPLVTVWAEGPDASSAQERAALWVARVEEAIAAD